MSKLNLSVGAEKINDKPILNDFYSLESLKDGTSDPKVQAAIEKLQNNGRAFFDQALVYLADESNPEAVQMVLENGGLTVELVNALAEQLKEQSIEEKKKDRLRSVAKDALSRVTGKGSSGVGTK